MTWTWAHRLKQWGSVAGACLVIVAAMGKAVDMVKTAIVSAKIELLANVASKDDLGKAMEKTVKAASVEAVKMLWAIGKIKEGEIKVRFDRFPIRGQPNFGEVILPDLPEERMWTSMRP